MKKLFGLAMISALLAAPMANAADKTMSPDQTRTQRTEMKQTRTVERTTQPTSVRKGEMTTRPVLGVNTIVDQRISQDWARGQWSLVTRQYPEAIESFRQVLSVEPDNVHALNSLSIALYQQGQYDEALRNVTRAISLDPINPRLFLTKAEILDAQQQPREAAEAYLTFAAMAPDDGAVVPAQRRADELFRQLEPQLSEGWRGYLMGLNRLSLHRPQEAINGFEKFLSEHPSDARIQNLLGRAYLELGQPEVAIQHFNQALKVSTNDPTALFQLGSSYELRGESKMASDAWQKFVQFAPKSESALLLKNRRLEDR